MRRWRALVVLVPLLLSACSGGVGDGSVPSSDAPPSDADGRPGSQGQDPADGPAAGDPGTDPDAGGPDAGDGLPGDGPDAGPTDPGPTHTGPMRAVWVHLFDDALKSRASIGHLVDELVAADATAVVAQVARRHDAYHAGGALPRTTDPRLEDGLDVLAELLEQAHARDLEVHAWISVAPTWHDVYEGLPQPAGWVPAAHGRRAPESQRWVSRTAAGEWTDYLDIGLPEVHAHVASVVGELVTRYAVDGVHLDYVRYAGADHGYHPTALDRYRTETGATGTPAPSDPGWSDWRRAQGRAVLQAAGAAIDAAGSDAALTAAVVTWGAGPEGSGGFDGTRTATEALQDWPGWVRDGLVDAVLPMNYFRAHVPEQAAWFTQWLRFEAELAAASDVRIVPGVGAWLQSEAAVLDQVGEAMAAADGAAVYSYQQPTDSEVAREDGVVRRIWERLARTGWGSAAPRA